MIEEVRTRIQTAIDEKLFPCCVAGVVRPAGDRIIVAAGTLRGDAGSEPVRADSIFDVASLTKAIPTSCLALWLAQHGRLDIDAPVNRYLPAFGVNRTGEITVRHLLTQTLDFGMRLSSLKQLSGPEILHAVMNADLKALPGRAYCYSNATSILLGLVVESASGEPLDTLAAKVFFAPLEMADTGFVPRSVETAVPTEIDEWRATEVRGEVHDESAWALRPRAVGSAGLFSTVPDLLRFLEMLLSGGEWRGHRYFSSEMVDRMSQNQIAHLGLRTGLGWELDQERFMGRLRSPRTIGKTGFTGCMCLVDFRRCIGLVLLSNWTYPRRKGDTTALNAFRSDIADIVLEHACDCNEYEHTF